MVAIMALPIMTVVPMIAKQNGHEGDYAAGMTVVTLVASAVTIPLVQLLAFLQGEGAKGTSSVFAARLCRHR